MLKFFIGTVLDEPGVTLGYEITGASGWG